MARAYKKTYLNGAMRNLAVMMDISDKNDGTYTTGPEYWAGWVLAYYQWLSRRSFPIASPLFYRH